MDDVYGVDPFEGREGEIARYYQADRVPQPLERTAALAEYLRDRDDWPRLQLAVNEHGNWDIVVRVDGGYGREDAERMLRWCALQVARIQFPGENAARDAA